MQSTSEITQTGPKRRSPFIEQTKSSVFEKPALNLSDLLDQTIIGRAIKSTYNKEKQLNAKYQAYLVDIIAQHFVNAVPFRKLRQSDFEKLANDIVSLFPNESPKVYYTAPIFKKNSNTNRSIVARGKLVDKYRNRLRFLTGFVEKAGGISLKNSDEDDESVDEFGFKNDEKEQFDNECLWNSTPSTSVTDSSLTEDFSKHTFNLSDLLDKTIVGRAIKRSYNSQKRLDEKCQIYLVDIIVQHFVNSVPFRKLLNSDFEKLAREIVNVFPNESSEVFYSPPVAKRNSITNKSIPATGKLVYKYKNKIRFLKHGCLKNSPALIPLMEDEEDEDSIDADACINDDNDDIEDYVSWLQKHHKPWSKVQENWSKTFSYRQKIFKSEGRACNVVEILEKFPIIKNPLGYALIGSDFKILYPGSYRKIYATFEHIFNKLLKLRKNTLTTADNVVLEKIQSSELNTETRHFLMLNLLVALLPVRSASKKKKINWNPTTNDSTEGIVVKIRSSDEIDEAVKKKRITLKGYGLSLLPFIIVEAPSSKEVKNIYVSFDSIIYEVESVIKAVDVCFQLFHVLHLVYPYESKHIWMFIQLAMYEMETKCDNIPNVQDVVNKIKTQG